MMVVAQFWSFANDVYTPEQGKRLFAIVGIGQTLGAILGGVVAGRLIGPLGVNQLMLVAAGILVAYLVITRIVNRRMLRSAAATGATPAAEAPLDRRGGFELVLRDRYLLLIGLLLLVLNFVNTNGVYLLSRLISQEAARLAAAGATNGLPAGEFEDRFIGGFYAGYFTWVNAVTAFVQLFLVSRIMQRFGVRAALYALPVVAFGGYSLLAFAPVLALIRVTKVGEDALDYSLNNTARHALFLPTSREAKYKAKAAVDTFVTRMGDVMSAGVVYLGKSFSVAISQFAVLNVLLAMVWLWVAGRIAWHHRRRTV
jgi:AAA family ATP:ADP antiporter